MSLSGRLSVHVYIKKRGLPSSMFTEVLGITIAT